DDRSQHGREGRIQSDYLLELIQHDHHLSVAPLAHPLRDLEQLRQRTILILRQRQWTEFDRWRAILAGRDLWLQGEGAEEIGSGRPCSLHRARQSAVESGAEFVDEALAGRSTEQVRVRDQDLAVFQLFSGAHRERGLAKAARRNDDDALTAAGVCDQAGELARTIGEMLTCRDLAVAERVTHSPMALCW